MKFTEEQLKKINTAKSAEELMALAKAEGIEMSEEEIKAKFAEMHNEGEIADDELDNVAGGACAESLGDNRCMRIRIKGTNREYDVHAEGDDINGHYVYAMNDDGSIYGKVYDNRYDIVYTGASGSF